MVSVAPIAHASVTVYDRFCPEIVGVLTTPLTLKEPGTKVKPVGIVSVNVTEFNAHHVGSRNSIGLRVVGKQERSTLRLNRSQSRSSRSRNGIAVHSDVVTQNSETGKPCCRNSLLFSVRFICYKFIQHCYSSLTQLRAYAATIFTLDAKIVRKDTTPLRTRRIFTAWALMWQMGI